MKVFMGKPRAYSYVRMSRDLQLKGDSLRRQMEQSATYAAEHGFELDEEFNLHDIGVSAYKGANVSQGALGQFLEAVRERKVAPGSYLLVESLDRLSRQEVRRSLTLLFDILDSGINVVTLADRYVYESGKTDTQDLMMSIISMSRAHEESRMKSQRISAAWERKRREAKSKKLTQWCPKWLELSANKASYEKIQNRVSIVNWIFEQSAAGVGNFTITRRLNESGVETFSESRGWHESYIAKILASRAVLGEFQPHRRVDGKRVPEGPPIPDYFPAIVSENLFYRAEAEREKRRVSGGGRKGATVSNLFSKIAKCAYCHSRMHFMDKGQGPKGGTYLVCDSARRGLECDRTGWRYDQFEASFLGFIREIDLEPLFRANGEAEARHSLDQAIASLHGQLSEARRLRDIAFSLIEEGDSPYLREKYRERERAVLSLESHLQERERAREAMQVEAGRFYESKAQIKELISRLQAKNGEESYKLRSQVASRLQSLVTALRLAPSGMAGFGKTADSPWKSRFQPDSSNHKFFLVVLKNGASHTVFPDDHDPLQSKGHVHLYEEGTQPIDSGDPKAFKMPMKLSLLLERAKASRKAD